MDQVIDYTKFSALPWHVYHDGFIRMHQACWYDIYWFGGNSLLDVRADDITSVPTGYGCSLKFSKRDGLLCGLQIPDGVTHVQMMIVDPTYNEFSDAAYISFMHPVKTDRDIKSESYHHHSIVFDIEQKNKKIAGIELICPKTLTLEHIKKFPGADNYN